MADFDAADLVKIRFILELLRFFFGVSIVGRGRILNVIFFMGGFFFKILRIARYKRKKAIQPYLFLTLVSVIDIHIYIDNVKKKETKLTGCGFPASNARWSSSVKMPMSSEMISKSTESPNS